MYLTDPRDTLRLLEFKNERRRHLRLSRFSTVYGSRLFKLNPGDSVSFEWRATEYSCPDIWLPTRVILRKCLALEGVPLFCGALFRGRNRGNCRWRSAARRFFAKFIGTG